MIQKHHNGVLYIIDMSTSKIILPNKKIRNDWHYFLKLLYFLVSSGKKFPRVGKSCCCKLGIIAN